MYLLAVNLYEFGQFLQILLWISLPMVLIALLVTTYLHYRRKRKQKDEEAPFPGYAPDSDRLANGLLIGEPAAALPEGSGNAYRGLLWMKDKYEQYREQTDRKYEKLKEELVRSEQKYLELLSLRSSPQPEDKEPIESPAVPQLPGEKDRQISFLQSQLDQRIKNYHQLEQLARKDRARAEEANSLYLQAQQELEELKSKIQTLNERVAQETGKVTDLTGKLENNIRLLLHIHQELDRSLMVEKRLPGNEPYPQPAADEPGSPENLTIPEIEEAPSEIQRNPLPEDTKIVAWVECEEMPEGARQIS